MKSMTFSWREDRSETVVTVCRAPAPSALRRAAGDGRQLWVVDSEVARLWARHLEEAAGACADRTVLRASEEEKSLDGLARLLETLHGAGANRGWRVVAAGGGVTMDIAALAASLYNRGLHLTLVPTTLLGMVDACLGGKTGVNLAGAKNKVGTVYPADRVAVFTDFVSTLPARELRNGTAEALKTSVIADRAIAGILARKDPDDLPEVVRRCLQAKARVIGEDLHDRGRRQLLNLGHTLGHALESHSGFDLGHGEAVALGMLAAAWMADRLEGGEMHRELSKAAAGLGLPLRLARRTGAGEIMEFLRHDKKATDGGRRWILPLGWEDCRIRRLPPGEELPLLRGALEAISP